MRSNRDPFRKLNRDLALLGVGIVTASALVGAAIGKSVEVLAHRHRASPHVRS